MTLKSNLRTLAPRGIHAYRILGGQLRGRIIVTSLHDYPAAVLGRTERALLAWFRKNVKSGETWLDVGAHYGYTAIALAELVGHRGHVYAFEPSITAAGCLSRTRALNGLSQVAVVPFGLGGPGGLRTMLVPIDRGMANHAFGSGDTEHIYVVGFDYLWAELSKSPVDGVKIDVQGMELDVLQGMAEMLRDQGPKLVVELHAGVDRNRLEELLRKAGYCLPGTPVNAAEAIATYRDDRSYVFARS